MVQSQPGNRDSEKNPSQKRADGVAKGVSLEFKPQYHTHKKRKHAKIFKNDNIPLKKQKNEKLTY
jgi:hypothetical protein